MKKRPKNKKVITRRIALLFDSDKHEKKYKLILGAIYSDNSVKRRTIYIGATGHSDYTQPPHDKEKLRRYYQRHSVKENWKISGFFTAGFWAKHLLWWKKSIREAIKAIRNKFNIKVYDLRNEI